MIKEDVFVMKEYMAKMHYFSKIPLIEIAKELKASTSTVRKAIAIDDSAKIGTIIKVAEYLESRKP